MGGVYCMLYSSASANIKLGAYRLLPVRIFKQDFFLLEVGKMLQVRSHSLGVGGGGGCGHAPPPQEF